MNMNEYAQIYSEYGLKEMIQDNKNKILEKQKKFQEICEGNRYDFLCANRRKKVIQEDIKCYENDIKELESALEIQKYKLKNY